MDSVMGNEHDTTAALAVVQQCLVHVLANKPNTTDNKPTKDNKLDKPQ